MPFTQFAHVCTTCPWFRKGQQFSETSKPNAGAVSSGAPQSAEVLREEAPGVYSFEMFNLEPPRLVEVAFFFSCQNLAFWMGYQHIFDKSEHATGLCSSLCSWTILDLCVFRCQVLQFATWRDRSCAANSPWGQDMWPGWFGEGFKIFKGWHVEDNQEDPKGSKRPM